MPEALSFVSPRRDISAARRFFRVALEAHGEPHEVVTDLAQALETVIEELIRRRFTTLSGIAPTASSATTVDSKRDSDRCAGLRPIAARMW